MDSTLGMRVDLLREFGRRAKNSSVLSGLPVVGSDVTVGGEEGHQQEKVQRTAWLAKWGQSSTVAGARMFQTR